MSAQPDQPLPKTVPIREGLRYLWRNGPMRRVIIIGLLLRLVYCMGPIVFYGLAMGLIRTCPLTPAGRRRLREWIERRNERLRNKVV